MRFESPLAACRCNHTFLARVTASASFLRAPRDVCTFVPKGPFLATFSAACSRYPQIVAALSAISSAPTCSPSGPARRVSAIVLWHWPVWVGARGRCTRSLSGIPLARERDEWLALAAAAPMQRRSPSSYRPTALAAVWPLTPSPSLTRVNWKQARVRRPATDLRVGKCADDLFPPSSSPLLAWCHWPRALDG